MKEPLHRCRIGEPNRRLSRSRNATLWLDMVKSLIHVQIIASYLSVGTVEILCFVVGRRAIFHFTKSDKKEHAHRPQHRQLPNIRLSNIPLPPPGNPTHVLQWYPPDPDPSIRVGICNKIRNWGWRINECLQGSRRKISLIYMSAIVILSTSLICCIV